MFMLIFCSILIPDLYEREGLPDRSVSALERVDPLERDLRLSENPEGDARRLRGCRLAPARLLRLRRQLVRLSHRRQGPRLSPRLPFVGLPLAPLLPSQLGEEVPARRLENPTFGELLPPFFIGCDLDSLPLRLISEACFSVPRQNLSGT